MTILLGIGLGGLMREVGEMRGFLATGEHVSVTPRT